MGNLCDLDSATWAKAWAWYLPELNALPGTNRPQPPQPNAVTETSAAPEYHFGGLASTRGRFNQQTVPSSQTKLPKSSKDAV